MSNLYMKIYTDGACQVSNKIGGYATILLYNNKVLREITGREENTTNNKMELMAVIAALRVLSRKAWSLEINTDSEYVVKGITKWIPKWLQNGWKTAKGNPIKNKELWLELHSLIQRHSIEWIHVHGHSGDFYNERCDQLAKQAIDS